MADNIEAKQFLKSKAFGRHVKRYVVAPTHRFAAIVPPELSTLCREELYAQGLSETEVTEAGVEFSGSFGSCYLANMWLRTASRILCRLPAFRAGIAEELFHKVSSVRWELWLNVRIPFRVDAYVEHSRIQHEGQVADTVFDGIRQRFRGLELSSPSRWNSSGRDDSDSPSLDSVPQRILVHLRKNHCEISLDTTGAHLHQRGYRLKHSGAPLRETLAAAVLLKAGWRGDTPLVDGMCGAGTSPIEGALMSRRVPPGFFRTFLFQEWPAYQEKTWQHLLNRAREQVLEHSPIPVVALDRDPEALKIARENAGRAGVEHDVQWKCMDFFSFRPADHNLRPGLLVLNPPYGKRLGGEGRDLYERLGTHMRRSFEGWQAVVLAPSRSLAAGLKLPSMRLWKITHGGMPIVVARARL